ncbi:histone-lysine N-methyltransferase SETD1B-like [Carassius carassius]|uniref:histone-lysine N-methyltransferase SETD1B-like n=1 Tax=Carassius carassius TaxID=217509 RepID=UPI0028686838|nr:histone-lysine N-methyltransferase SETD1B-like [Carassius carassius]
MIVNASFEGTIDDYQFVKFIFHTDNNKRRTKMATSLLRLGRLGSVKCLLREGWSTPRTPFVAALCTKGDVPPKTAKASSKTIEVDERASLLAYKPAVAFPSKLSATGFLPTDIALGESETTEAVSTAGANETTAGCLDADAAAAEEITEVPATNEVPTGSEARKALDVEAEGQEDEDDSSSSSSSDSDSDSDSDDEKPEIETPVESGEKAAPKKSPGLTIEVDVADKEAKPESASPGEAQENPETVTKAKVKEAPTPSAKPDGSDETLVDPAPILSSSTTEAIPEVSSESITAETPDNTVHTATEVKIAPKEEIVVEKEPEIKAEAAVKVAAEVVPEVPTEPSPEEVTKTASHGEAPEAPGDVTASPEDASSQTEAGAPAALSEELVDPAPVAADAVEARADSNVVETPEEQAPEPEPEPFDNSTYKNLQHHQYNMYTFADVDVELCKYRLPQPSSGRS